MDPAERTLPDSIGRYEIVRLLGRGAMGRVLLARDPVLDRAVAVKLLRDDLRLAPEQRAALISRMRQEARASARVTHPNIVGLFDMGEDAELGLYLVFEYAEGATLKERLLRGPLGFRAAATLARELGDALSTAHAAGVLHRDIKPENVILTATGAKIADFGIARVPDSTLTRDGGLLGTPAYSAPESISHGTFSPASDQFSMAATLYEAIGQRRAFPGEDAVSVAARIANEEALPIAISCGLSAHVDAALLRALAKDPAQRFDSAREFGKALADALELQPRSALPTLPDQHHAALQQRPELGEGGSARLLAGGVAVGALLGVAAMQLTMGLRKAPVASEITLPVARQSSTTRAIGWLAEAQRPRPRSPSSRAASSGRQERREPSDAGALPLGPSGEDAGISSLVDAEAPPDEQEP
ncbi:MAG TPA: serine/threonine-protein kinase [Polyangiaceae bacterium]|nr:serine/threonine-protein kinase [Polyangiaceae bacterium]